MGFGKLLKEMMDKKGMKQSELSEITGLPKTTLSGMITRDISKVEIEVFLKICKALDCDPIEFYNEYLNEENKPLPPSFVRKYNSIDDDSREIINTLLELEYQRYLKANAKPIIMFRRLSTNKASAGSGYDLNNVDEWCEIEVIDTPEARQADFAVEIDGASMEPTYYDGDILYIQLEKEIPVGKIGLFMKGGKGYIKECGKDRLISHNDDYDDIYPDGDEIECIGRVIGRAELP